MTLTQSLSWSPQPPIIVYKIFIKTLICKSLELLILYKFIIYIYSPSLSCFSLECKLLESKSSISHSHCCMNAA